MRRIARGVDVSATAIYRHFKDKKALLEEITDEGFDIFRGYLEEALAESTPLDRLRALTRRYLEFALDHPHHYDFIFLVPRKNVRRFPRDFARRDDLTFHILSRQVSEAMQEGHLAPGDPMETAMSIWAHAHGLVALHRAGRFGGNSAGVRPFYERSIDRLLEGLKHPGTKTRR